MKKIGLIIAIIIINATLFSCKQYNGSPELVKRLEIIDSCEYLISKNAYGNIITHKGNCKNSIHYTKIHDTIYVVLAK